MVEPEPGLYEEGTDDVWGAVCRAVKVRTLPNSRHPEKKVSVQSSGWPEGQPQKSVHSHFYIFRYRNDIENTKGKKKNLTNVVKGLKLS